MLIQICKAMDFPWSDLYNYVDIIVREFERTKYTQAPHRLRSCSADYVHIGNKWILRSYNTIVAWVEYRDGMLVGVDVLRYVYGYTSTSAQHIAKFFHDIGVEKVIRIVD